MTEPPPPGALALLREVCEAVAEGRYDAVERVFALAEADPTTAPFAEAFGMMVVQLEARELRQAQLVAELEEAGRRLREAQARLAAENDGLRRVMDRLEVRIDQEKRASAVREIVDSDVFQSLQARARALRARG